MKLWRTIAKKTILDHSKFLKIEQHSIELPDGRILENWPWVVSPDYALVLPVTDRKTIFLFRQTKYAVDGVSLAPVGGYLESGEDALTAARRELREEMGCEGSEWISLGSYPNNGNHGGGKGHLFLALNVKSVGEPVVDDLEEMKLCELSMDDLERSLLNGEIKVMGWVAMAAVGLLYLKKR